MPKSASTQPGAAWYRLADPAFPPVEFALAPAVPISSAADLARSSSLEVEVDFWMENGSACARWWKQLEEAVAGGTIDVSALLPLEPMIEQWLAEGRPSAPDVPFLATQVAEVAPTWSTDVERSVLAPSEAATLRAIRQTRLDRDAFLECWNPRMEAFAAGACEWPDAVVAIQATGRPDRSDFVESSFQFGMVPALVSPLFVKVLVESGHGGGWSAIEIPAFTGEWHQARTHLALRFPNLGAPGRAGAAESEQTGGLPRDAPAAMRPTSSGVCVSASAAAALTDAKMAVDLKPA